MIYWCHCYQIKEKYKDEAKTEGRERKIEPSRGETNFQRVVDYVGKVLGGKIYNILVQNNVG